jgi:hypothetical protein
MSAPTLHGTTPLTPDDVSTPDALSGIGSGTAANRRLALLAHQRWESEGGALGLLQPEPKHRRRSSRQA